MPKKLCRIWTARDNGADTELLDETRKMQRDYTYLGVSSEKKLYLLVKDPNFRKFLNSIP